MVAGGALTGNPILFFWDEQLVNKMVSVSCSMILVGLVTNLLTCLHFFANQVGAGWFAVTRSAFAAAWCHEFSYLPSLSLPTQAICHVESLNFLRLLLGIQRHGPREDATNGAPAARPQSEHQD